MKGIKKMASLQGAKYFAKLNLRNPNKDELEVAYRKYEKKTGRNRHDMSFKDIFEYLPNQKKR